MHLQGKELVSAATQRAARQLVATALTVLLAKAYGLNLTGLEVFGVAIDPATVAGAAFIVVAFQLATFLVQWGGDWFSLAPWNSAERFSGVARMDIGARMLDRIGQIEEHLEIAAASAKQLQGQADQAVIDHVTAKTDRANELLSVLRKSVRSHGWYANLYFYGLYLLLPVGVAVAALLLPSANVGTVHP